LALQGFTGAIEEALASGETVSLTGFGSFSVTTRAARTGRNPQSGKEIKIAARKVVKFKAGKGLADDVA
jgi:DNA-binding protein HU-beta